jgi:hypothetical protein
MSHESASPPRAVLDPLDRSSEVPFGLAMVALGVALGAIAIGLGG